MHHGVLLGKHEQSLNAILGSMTENHTQMAQVQTLIHTFSTQLLQIQQQLPPVPHPAQLPASPTDQPEVHMPTPEPFTGEPDKCRGFIMQCDNVFTHRAQSFRADAVRVAYLVGLLRGKALEWAEARLGGGTIVAPSYAEFLEEFRHVFDHSARASEAAARINELYQGRRSVTEYSVDFRTLAVDSGWNETALRSKFVFGLNDNVRDELIYREEPDSLNLLISLCIRIDNRIRERRSERRHPAHLFSRFPSPQTTGAGADYRGGPASSPGRTQQEPSLEEPMQVGRAHLTSAERRRRQREGECMYCGRASHQRDDCPFRPKEGAPL